jgi:hypothetical protein
MTYVVSLLFACGSGALWAAPILLEQVRVVDARGDQGVHDLLIEGDRIVALDPEIRSEDTVSYDGRGRTVVPGLIDAHVHITKTCGMPFLAPETMSVRDRQLHHLRSYLALGITTVVDPGITAVDARHMLGLAAIAPSPSLLFVGPIVSPRDGYPSVIFPDLAGVSSPEEIGPLLDSFADLDSKGVKVTMEDGPLRAIWPLHSQSVLDTIVAEAAKRDLDIYVHAMDAEMGWAGLELNPHAYVHAPKVGDEKLAKALAERGIFVQPTLAILGGLRVFDDLDSLDEAWIKNAVLPDEISTNRLPNIKRELGARLLDIYAPMVPGWLQGISSAMFWRTVPGHIDAAIAATAQLHTAGVSLVVASDAGGSPVAPYLMHGTSTHVEMSLLMEAGLSPLETLTAATWNPARMLRMEDELGTVEVGKRADLVVVAGDPLTDLETLRTPVWVVRAGEFRTPAEWLGSTEVGRKPTDHQSKEQD